jgi:RimJ/RimL family protein N-acetyltransferase
MPHPLPDQIDTEHIRLRQPEIADAHSIFEAYAQDPEVCRFMIWTPHTSELATREFIESCIAAWQTESRRPYVITGRDDNIAIGMIEARIYGITGTTVDVGYVLARSHWGKGLMPEAITALADIALVNASIYRVQASCDTDNIPSQRALEKSGFKREGRLERYTVHPNISSEPRACFMYGLCR